MPRGWGSPKDWRSVLGVASKPPSCPTCSAARLYLHGPDDDKAPEIYPSADDLTNADDDASLDDDGPLVRQCKLTSG